MMKKPISSSGASGVSGGKSNQPSHSSATSGKYNYAFNPAGKGLNLAHTIQPEKDFTAEQIVDEFAEINSSSRFVTLSRFTKPRDANKFGKISNGYLLKFFEEAGTVVCTRYCNYTAAEIALQGGGTFDQVHCCMMYLDHVEFMLPAYAGDMVSCTTEVVYTAHHVIEMRGLIWSEDIITSSRRLAMKATAWYCAFNIQKDWRLSRIPKLTLDAKLEREGQLRYEQYKEERMNSPATRVNFVRPSASSLLDESQYHTVSYSETVLTHIADVNDCNTHMFMSCGSIIELMDECASLVAYKHTHSHQVTSACGYNINFTEMIPRGCLLIVYGRLTFTAKKLMEVEVIVDAELMADSEMETKRSASGYFGVVALNEANRVVPIPTLKFQGQDEETQFKDGKRRYDSMKIHLKHTENRVTGPDGGISAPTKFKCATTGQIRGYSVTNP